MSERSGKTSKSALNNMRKAEKEVPEATQVFEAGLSALRLAIDALAQGSGSLAANWKTPMQMWDASMWTRLTDPGASKPWRLSA